MAEQRDADPVDPVVEAVEAVGPADGSDAAAAGGARAVLGRVRAAWCFLVSGLG